MVHSAGFIPVTGAVAGSLKISELSIGLPDTFRRILGAYDGGTEAFRGGQESGAGLARRCGVGAGPTWCRQALDTLPVPGNVGSGGMSLVASSCPSAGSCSAVAVYTDSGGNSQVALFDQVNGSWRLTELDLSHLAGLDASGDLGPESISCTSAGNCAVVGYYQDASQTYQGFVAMETGGVWAPASEAQMPGNVNTTNYGVNHSGDEDLADVGRLYLSWQLHGVRRLRRQRRRQRCPIRAYREQRELGAGG